jgi:hypothetical protein
MASALELTERAKDALDTLLKASINDAGMTAPVDERLFL